MTDLGWSWSVPLSNYAPITAQPWSFGDTFQVAAAGDEVDAFSSTFRAGAALTGVTPPIGSATLVVDHTVPFEISWTPEGDAEATILLALPTGNRLCYCDAPDSTGKLVVDASLLSPVTYDITLARLNVTTVTSNNATIDLVGAVVQKGPIEIH
jgi:hypothetical protein